MKCILEQEDWQCLILKLAACHCERWKQETDDVDGVIGEQCAAVDAVAMFAWQIEETGALFSMLGVFSPGVLMLSFFIADVVRTIIGLHDFRSDLALCDVYNVLQISDCEK